MEASDTNTNTQGAGGSILVADDSATIARLLEAELAAAGYDVTTVGDGRLALDTALERCPDLVLADVTMPTMGGLELTHLLRGDPRTAGVSIILITAGGSAASSKGCRPAPTTTSSSRSTRPSCWRGCAACSAAPTSSAPSPP